MNISFTTFSIYSLNIKISLFILFFNRVFLYKLYLIKILLLFSVYNVIFIRNHFLSGTLFLNMNQCIFIKFKFFCLFILLILNNTVSFYLLFLLNFYILFLLYLRFFREILFSIFIHFYFVVLFFHKLIYFK